MKKIIDIIKDEVRKAFLKCGYDEKLGMVALSNRPDLCQYQCNGAMAGAKQYKKAPFMIAEEIADVLQESGVFEKIEAVKPGFINITLKDCFINDYLKKMAESEDFGIEKAEKPQTILIDFGGANVAKPLHVGHLRTAIIGESIKRISRKMGHKVIGDVHLGDWGLQMGLIITELKKRQPELIYFQKDYTGEYTEEAPFTIGELEEIYPCASKRSKEDAAYKEEARECTYLLQKGERGYVALWNHILNVSVEDLKKNYDNLNVEFDLWKKESDAQPYIPDMVNYLKEGGYAKISEGALVVEVKEETDTREIPPCMILKSDGATLYNTTDLATIVEREKLFQPDRYIYVVDNRQELYFEQVFRCAKKTKLVRDHVSLVFLGFGTMNGKDGKPFKTRDGGVMRLSALIQDINQAVYQKIMDNREVDEEEAKETAKIIGLAALKYGDLSNQATKDYAFDIERFTSFEGNTGPYILYTIVRIKSILKKYKELTKISSEELWEGRISSAFLESGSESESSLKLAIIKYQDVVEAAYEENAPHRICQFVYELSDSFNKFYHENKILTEEDTNKRDSWIALIMLVHEILNSSIALLGIEAPERM